MATQNRSLRHLAFVGMLLGGATVLVYACGGDDTTGPGIVTPTGGSSGAGGSASGSAGNGGDATNNGGNAGAGGGSGGNAAGAAGAGPDGGPVACEPSSTFDNTTRLKGLLAADGGLPAL